MRIEKILFFDKNPCIDCFNRLCSMTLRLNASCVVLAQASPAEFTVASLRFAIMR